MRIYNSESIELIENLLNIGIALYSFVEVMVTAVDARTPYNISHTRRIALMIKK